MNVSVDATGEIERSLFIEIPASDVDSKVEQRLKESAGKVRINGFRPGKVPVREIKRRYGESIRFEVLSELVDAAYRNAVSEQKLAVATEPQIEILENEAGSAVKFKAVLEVYPQIELQSLDQIVVKKPVVEITPADVDTILDRVRKKHATWEEKSGAAQEGDQVTMDFEGSIDGELFEGGAAQDFDLVLGSKQLIPGFEDQLIGAVAGESRTVNVTFPADYGNEALKARDAQFAVTVKKVSSEKLPEMDDAFAKEMGIEEGGAEKLREEITNNMQTQLDRAVKNQINTQVFEQLAKLNTVAIPKGPVAQEMSRRRKEMTQSLQSQHQISQEQIDSIFPLETFKEQAEHTVKVALLLGHFIEHEKIEPEESHIEAKLDELAQGYSDPDALKRSYRADKSRMQWVRSSVLEELAVQRLMAHGQVEDQPVSYEDAINGKFGQETEESENESVES